MNFKSKADNILNTSPRSIQELLDGPPGKGRKKETVQSKNIPPDNSKGCTRVHVHIRLDLANKMLDLVYERKKRGYHKKKDASQRAIIEEALEYYFQKLSH